MLTDQNGLSRATLRSGSDKKWQPARPAIRPDRSGKIFHQNHPKKIIKTSCRITSEVSSATAATRCADCNPDKRHRDLADSTASNGATPFAAARGCVKTRIQSFSRTK